MRIVVLGAGGMLGQEVVAAANLAGHEALGYGRYEVDVTDRDRVVARLDLDRPDAVINCAAWTDVDGAEDDPEAVMAVNRDGAGIVAAATAAVGARVVYVSSDYVFDGRKGSDYVETDPVGPISVYGMSKLAGEEATAAANRRSHIVRTSWLFGLGGSNFVDAMIRLGRSQKQVLVVRDQVGSPTFTWHVAHGLVRILDSDAYGLHHLAGGGHCSRYELAREIYRQMGMDTTVLSATSDMFPAKAMRPAWSGLDTASQYAIRLPHWKDGLADYIKQVKDREAAES